MEDPRRSKFGIYVRQLADLMGLRDWIIVVHHTSPDNPNHVACVYIPLGRRHCNLYLSDTFLFNDADNQRETIVHELLHCHYDAMQKVTRNLLSKREYKAWNISFESGIDATAAAWALTLPLPEFKDETNQEEAKDQVSSLPEKSGLEVVGGEDTPEMQGYL